MTVNYRRARPEDASKLAELSILAGGGTFELLLKGLKRGVSVHQVMTKLCASDATEYSYKFYTVAETEGEIAGAVNHISIADRYALAENINPILQQEFNFGWFQLLKFYPRAKHLRGMNTIKAPKNSLHINDIAVNPKYQGMKIGKNLVLQTIEKAKQEVFEYVSLYVWDDNEHAIEFYRRLGFEIKGRADVKRHRYLPHEGSYLMLYEIKK